MGHRWDFIRDYETDPAELAQPELKHLAAVWLEQRERLETRDAFVRAARQSSFGPAGAPA